MYLGNISSLNKYNLMGKGSRSPFKTYILVNNFHAKKKKKNGLQAV